MSPHLDASRRPAAVLVLMLAALVSCAPGSSPELPPDLIPGYYGRSSALVAVRQEPAGARCPHGGSRIDAGLDANGNGTLSASEIASTQYACNGAPGASGAPGLDALVAMADEPAGARCNSGGKRVDTGLDADGSGILEPGEVTSTGYVCNGADGTQGMNGFTSLLTLSAEPPGANCTGGGSVLHSGLDADRNGILDHPEISSTRYVCSGTAGTGSLVQMVDEPAGANCAAGGKAVSVGLDADASGTLEPGEITSTGYVCDGASGTNGTSGADGAAGLTALLTVATEPAGANCANGGSVVRSGLDTNRSGALDAGEIDATRYTCNGANGTNGANGADGTNGANGANALLSVTDEPAGGNCAAGGKKVSAGLDANASGTLDPGEIGTTSYVCNGTNGSDGTNGTDGADGADGLSALVSVAAEAAGGNCANGGTVIRSGLDANRSGVLDAGEISGTRYTCNGTDGTNGADGADGTNGTNGTNGASGLTTLVSVTSEPAGGNCTAGGKKVSVGLDTDASGSLDPGEVNSTSYVCNGIDGTNGTNGTNGADGISTLLTVATEASGANCPNGGAVIRSGPDANHSGVLDAGEVVATRYACNGAGGASGADGYTALLTLTAEPAGSNCTSGGTAIASGLDTNRSGTLDPGEIASTRYVCSGSGGLSWVDVTGSSVQAQPNTGYMADNGTAQVVVTLPASPAMGDVVRVHGIAAGGWRVAQNAGQSINGRALGLATGTFTARDSSRAWMAVASSADGMKLAAATWNGFLYTSADAGATWTARDSARSWMAVASSADGTKLVASEWGGHLFTSADSGATWTQRASVGNWMGVASSADGTRLAAAVLNGQIHTSTDSGVTWTARASTRQWNAIASSADGTRLLASALADTLFTSTDGGATWTARDGVRDWRGVASSADGTRLLAVADGGCLYTSTDGGVGWTARDSARPWYAAASSADGTRLAAVARYGDRIYLSSDGGATWVARDGARNWYGIASSADGLRLAAVADSDQLYTSSTWSSTGTAGSVSGGQWEAIELQYVGNGQFSVLSFAGNPTVQ